MARPTETRTGDFAPVVVTSGDSTRTVEMRWGFEPSAERKKPRFLVRNDSDELEDYARCLIPATALPLHDRDGAKWMVSLEEVGGVFCFAGVWQDASQTWPEAYAAVTVPAYPDLKFIKRRHIAILPRNSWAEWLAGVPAHRILKPLPRRSLKVLAA